MRLWICLFALLIIGPACDLSGKSGTCRQVVERGGKKLVKMVACAPGAPAKTASTSQR